jgi:hypothetical protein
MEQSLVPVLCSIVSPTDAVDLLHGSRPAGAVLLSACIVAELGAGRQQRQAVVTAIPAWCADRPCSHLGTAWVNKCTSCMHVQRFVGTRSCCLHSVVAI